MADVSKVEDNTSGQDFLWSSVVDFDVLGFSVYIRVFHKLHFAKKKRCNTSTHPSRVYINQI